MKTINPKSKTPSKKQEHSDNRSKSAIPFYISIVSITAIFALLTVFFLQKNENLKFLKAGLVQKNDHGKIVWDCPTCILNPHFNKAR